MIKDHSRPNAPTYKIGKVLGSGMIGIACLCQADNSLLKCLKLMSIHKIRDRALYRHIRDEVEIMYSLIGVPGVCQLEDIIINSEKDITLVLPFYALTDLWNYMKKQPGQQLREDQARHVF